MFGSETREWPNCERCDLGTLLAEDTVITAALVRRANVAAVGGYDEAMPVQGNEDWALWISLVERDGCGVILPEVLFHYRRRPESMSDLCSTGEAHLQTVAYLVRKHARAYERHLIEVLAQRAQAAAVFSHAHTKAQIDIRNAEQWLASLEAETARLQSRQVATNLEDSKELDGLRLAYNNSRAEVTALRSSLSWRITNPLRRLYDLFVQKRS